MPQPTVESLLAANEAFYRTFEALDLEGMRALWADEPATFCVHPGWPALRGYPAVLDSWARIMRNTTRIRFTLTGVDAHVEGTLGIVTCYENLNTEAGDESHGATVVSTNLFRYDPEADAWKLFHHHGAPAPRPEQPEETVLN